MIGFLRFLGVMNAAVWLGASVFFTLAVAPAFSAPVITNVIGAIYSGRIAHVVAERYYFVQYWCGAIALAHLLAEWVYLGRPLHRLTLGALLTAFCLGLVGGLWLQPKVERLHQIKFSRPEYFTPAQRAQASRSYGIWQTVSVVFHCLIIGGLVIYTWRVANPASGPRFIPASKFRS